MLDIGDLEVAAVSWQHTRFLPAEGAAEYPLQAQSTWLNSCPAIRQGLLCFLKLSVTFNLGRALGNYWVYIMNLPAVSFVWNPWLVPITV